MAQRGGTRPREFVEGTAAVFARPWSGRAKRRLRTSECRMLTAEEVYTSLLEAGPGAHGPVTTVIDGVLVSLDVELRPNAVWRRGRLFLRCPRCRGRCTRLYLPDVPGVALACRLCWGLTYASRSTRTYRDTQWGRGNLGLMGPLACTQRDWAYMETERERERRYAACCARWDARWRARQSTPDTP